MLARNVIPLGGIVIDLNNTGDKLTIGIPFKCEVVRAALLGIGSDANGYTVKFDSAVSGASRGDGDVATITLPAASQAGKMLYDDVYAGEILNPGDYVVVEVTADAGGANNAMPFLLVREIPEEDANLDNLVETA